MLLKKLVASADWGSIYAVSRHEDPHLKGTRVKHLPMNLLEEQVCRGSSDSNTSAALAKASPQASLSCVRQKVKELVKQAKDVTHVFHLAFAGVPFALQLVPA